MNEYYCLHYLLLNNTLLTDSLYFAITEKSIIDLVKPEKMSEYLEERYNWMVDPSLCGDSKTPLKMKIEFWVSDNMLALQRFTFLLHFSGKLDCGSLSKDVLYMDYDRGTVQ